MRVCSIIGIMMKPPYPCNQIQYRSWRLQLSTFNMLCPRTTFHAIFCTIHSHAAKCDDSLYMVAGCVHRRGLTGPRWRPPSQCLRTPSHAAVAYALLCLRQGRPAAFGSSSNAMESCRLPHCGLWARKKRSTSFKWRVLSCTPERRHRQHTLGTKICCKHARWCGMERVEMHSRPRIELLQA